ncbi:MAG: hypothetical protein AB1589_32050 [Cyanobacteriota bacterium]
MHNYDLNSPEIRCTPNMLYLLRTYAIAQLDSSEKKTTSLPPNFRAKELARWMMRKS